MSNWTEERPKFDKWFDRKYGSSWNLKSKREELWSVWQAGVGPYLTTRRQLEIAVEALKYIDQYNRKGVNPNSFTVGDGLNMRGEAGLALDAIKKIGPKIEEPEEAGG